MVLSDHLERLGPVDNQGVTRTVYGVVRREQEIREVIKRCSQRNIDAIDLDALILLKIGIYLLIFSVSYPDHAVVNEVVDFAKSRIKTFMNANLRSVIRQREDIALMINGFREFPIKYSISEYLIKNLEPLSQDVEEDLRYLNREPNFHLRVNPLITDFEAVKERLNAAGVDFRELPVFDSFEVRALGRPVKALLNENYVYVQNTGSQVVAMIAEKFCREPVLDCCAAPGTKSVTLALLRPGIKTFACDKSPSRLKVMQKFTGSFGLDDIFICAADIRESALKGDFNLIVADAPCTSAGTLRKNPDLKLKIDEGAVARNAQAQLEIVEALIPVLREGGYLLYAVCSFMKEESEDIFEKAVGAAGLEVIDLSGMLSEYGFLFRKAKWGYYLLPNPQINNDMFYLSLLKKPTRVGTVSPAYEGQRVSAFDFK